jgi:hypothetical protein
MWYGLVWLRACLLDVRCHLCDCDKMGLSGDYGFVVMC